LTVLAGFVLVPFALFGQTAFLAERVLGNVISAGIKLMVLAVVVGIGATLFGTLIRPSGEITLTQAASTILAAIAVFGLAVFVPGIAAWFRARLSWGRARRLRPAPRSVARRWPAAFWRVVVHGWRRACLVGRSELPPLSLAGWVPPMRRVARAVSPTPWSRRQHRA
jgi:hypothetical protein